MVAFRANWLIAGILLLAGCGGGSSTPDNVNTTGASKLFISGKTSGLSPQIVSYESTNLSTGSIDATRTITGTSTLLNNTRGIALDLTNDRLYVADFGGNSIIVFDNASATTGNTTPTRVITGANTGLNSPWAVYFDATNDRLYVSNFSSSAHNVLVFDNASSINGDVAPSRVISGFTLYAYSQLSGLSVDVTRDILYVMDFNGQAIYVIGNASTATGSMAASRVISGNQTGLSGAHGIETDSTNDQIIVSGYNSGTILIFASASSANGNIAPTRTITPTDITFSPVTTVLDSVNDKLYVLNSSVSRLEIINTASTASGSITPDTIVDLNGVSAPMGLAVDTR